jgi:hypothetical protein
MATARSAARPDFAAHDRAYRLPLDAVVAELRDVLGARLVAYVAGVTETRAVREWAEGVRAPRSPVPERLRLALQVTEMLHGRDSAGVVQAWFQGLNPRLEDRSPARVLREGDLEEVGPRILAAARAFAAG